MATYQTTKLSSELLTYNLSGYLKDYVYGGLKLSDIENLDNDLSLKLNPQFSYDKESHKVKLHIQNNWFDIPKKEIIKDQIINFVQISSIEDKKYAFLKFIDGDMISVELSGLGIYRGGRGIDVQGDIISVSSDYAMFSDLTSISSVVSGISNYSLTTNNLAISSLSDICGTNLSINDGKLSAYKSQYELTASSKELAYKDLSDLTSNSVQKDDSGKLCVYTHENVGELSNGFVKISVDCFGHVSSTTNVGKSDFSTILTGCVALSSIDQISAEVSSNPGRVLISNLVDEDGLCCYHDLTVKKISIQSYEEQCVKNTLCGDTLYIVDADYIEGFGQQLCNIAMGDNYEYLGNGVTDKFMYHELSAISSDTLISTALSIGTLSNDVYQAIANKSNIWLSTQTAETELCGQKLDKLTIFKFDTNATYHELCATGVILSSDIVFIEDDNLNAFNKTIISVADPVDSTDAVNKRYLENCLSDYKTDTKLSDILTSGENLDVDTAISAIRFILKKLGGM